MLSSSLVKSYAFVFCAALSATALAGPGQGFSWSFQTTSLTNSATNVAAAMRNAEAWPVVITDASNVGYGAAATLFSAGGTVGAASGSWQNIGTGFFSMSPNRLRAASSPDGRVAFAAADFSGNGLGGRVSSVGGGWGSLPAGTKAVAFDAHGTLYTATNSSVSGVGGYSGSAPIVDMAVSPFGEVGVISADMKFWQFSSWLGTWVSTTLPSVGTTPATESMDVEYDSLGRPHVVATVSNTLVAWDFSTVSGSWAATTIATGLPSSSTRATLAANDDGTVGTAWVDNNSQLIYAYKHDLDNWATSVVTNTGTISSGQVGVTYDYADLPVLAYRGSSSVIVAYDPVVVPEPAGLALVGVAATLLARRRHIAAA